MQLQSHPRYQEFNLYTCQGGKGKTVQTPDSMVTRENNLAGLLHDIFGDRYFRK